MRIDYESADGERIEVVVHTGGDGWKKLVRALARRARKSKGRTATSAHGCIVLKVLGPPVADPRQLRFKNT